jgi:hypothetical protein
MADLRRAKRIRNGVSALLSTPNGLERIAPPLQPDLACHGLVYNRRDAGDLPSERCECNEIVSHDSRGQKRRKIAVALLRTRCETYHVSVRCRRQARCCPDPTQ